ncbi:lysozyme [Agrobacterium rosae]|uniref:Lysozyme n=1 Tax=Agrobacterium rosae TaxID=1972867 RepID=A0A1R3TLP1_9HYPH|nr:lysozyme [Agrobacterium rosae]SCX19548.1 Lysozyme RrrD [Agrobacterium rosae]
MKTNKAGIDLIKRWEGCVLTCYLCPANIPTIGVGTTKGLTRSDVGKKTITMAEAERLLKEDLARFEADVTRLVKVPVNENQFSAMVSLAYNIGTGAFSSSTLLRLVNAKDYAGAAKQFDRWNKGGGKVLKGLVNRRNDEEALFRKPVAKAKA